MILCFHISRKTNMYLLPIDDDETKRTSERNIEKAQGPRKERIQPASVSIYIVFVVGFSVENICTASWHSWQSSFIQANGIVDGVHISLEFPHILHKIFSLLHIHDTMLIKHTNLFTTKVFSAKMSGFVQKSLSLSRSSSVTFHTEQNGFIICVSLYGSFSGTIMCVFYCGFEAILPKAWTKTIPKTDARKVFGVCVCPFPE